MRNRKREERWKEIEREEIGRRKRRIERKRKR